VKKSTFLKYVIDIAGLIFFMVLLSNITLMDIRSLSFFSPTEKNFDFRSSDFYQLVADSRHERKIDSNVVIVPIDGLSRQDILTLLEDIYISSPSVVGLDVFFSFPSENDAALYDFIQSHPNLILPMALETVGDDLYEISPTYLYDSLSTDRRGVVNFNIAHPYNVIRDFKVNYQTSSGEVYNFAAAISRLAKPDAIERLQQILDERGETTVDIDFPSWEYTCVDPDQVLLRSEDLNGKIVLLGDMSNPQDYHVTPIGDNVPGVLIHANAISTVIHGSCHFKLSKWWQMFVAMLLCSLYVVLKKGLRYFGDADNMIMRIVQAILLFVAVLIGTRLYISHNKTLELSMPLIAVALVEVALDCWVGCLSLARKVSSMCKGRKRKGPKGKALIVLVALFVWTANEAQARYYVHKVSGSVSCLRGDSYVNLESGQQIDVADKVRIMEQSSVSIVDKNTSRVYVSTETGVTTIADIILSARKQSEAITRLVYRQTMDSVKDYAKKPASLGATFRGDESQKSFTRLLYASMSGSLDRRKVKSSDSISLSRVFKGDQWYFRVENNSRELLYFGVIRIKDGSVGLMLEVGRFDGVSVLAIEPDNSVELYQYVFAETDPDVSYVLFATPVVFDMQELGVLFRSGLEPSKETGSVPLLYAISE